MESEIMVDYHTPQPEFKSPFDINDKDDTPLLLTAGVRQKERDDISSIVRNMKSDKRDGIASMIDGVVNELEPMIMPPMMPDSPTPVNDTDGNVYYHDNDSNAKRATKVAKSFTHEPLHPDRSIPLTGKSLPILKTLRDMQSESANNVIRSITRIHNEGDRTVRIIRNSNPKMVEMIRKQYSTYDFDWLDAKVKACYRKNGNVLCKTNKSDMPPTGWWKKEK